MGDAIWEAEGREKRAAVQEMFGMGIQHQLAKLPTDHAVPYEASCFSGAAAASMLREMPLSRAIEAKLTTTLSWTPAISRLTSMTTSMASAASPLSMMPLPTSRSMRLSHSMRAACPCGSGVNDIVQYSAKPTGVSRTQLSLGPLSQAETSDEALDKDGQLTDFNSIDLALDAQNPATPRSWQATG